MHEAVSALTDAEPSAEQQQVDNQAEPAVSVRKSLASKEHILSLIDGKPYKTLRRHLAQNGFTPEQYRERFGLRSDYPMVAPAYAERRRELAKAIGLGRKRKDPPTEPNTKGTERPVRRRSKSGGA